MAPPRGITSRDRVDRRFRPFNRLPKRLMDPLADWELRVLGKVVELHPVERFPRVADVGAGMGRLSRALSRLGYDVTAIDPMRPPRWVRRPRGGFFPGIKVRRREFLVSDAANFDLLVGVRPCGASQKLVRAAKQTPLVMCPCFYCSHVWPERSHAIPAIESFFREQGVGVRRAGREVFWTGESRRNRYVP